jgi:quinol monooxygenase YgiN
MKCDGAHGGLTKRPSGAYGRIRNEGNGPEAVERRRTMAVHVLAIITAKAGMRERILEAFRANLAAVHAEDGCIEYTATIDGDDAGSMQTRFGDDTFVVVEKWQSLEALRAHAAAPHMAAYAARTKDMIARRVIHVLEPA